jgi:UDP-galactopyranose mutase
VRSLLLESAPVPGGLIRSERLEGVLYEPHGSHIFHTEDEEVWDLANRMTPFRPYRHRVDILIEGKLLNWPILASDIEAQSRSEEILAQLEERRDLDVAARAQAANFEEWCLDLMGPILYERYIKPYTEKQWGRPARTLSAAWAPRRVQVRYDDDPYLFPDPYQGWPAGPGGYTDLIDGLLDSPLVSLRAETEVTESNLDDHLERERVDAVVLTCPLDAFCGGRFGRLEWRGIDVRSVHVPHVEYAQRAMVVNYPAAEYPFIRIHETKHASGRRCAGTVLGFEFTGGSPLSDPDHREPGAERPVPGAPAAAGRRTAGVLRRAAGQLRVHRHGRLHAPGHRHRRRRLQGARRAGRLTGADGSRAQTAPASATVVVPVSGRVSKTKVCIAIPSTGSRSLRYARTCRPVSPSMIAIASARITSWRIRRWSRTEARWPAATRLASARVSASSNSTLTKLLFSVVRALVGPRPV